MFFGEPYTLELLPATGMQVDAATLSVVQNVSDTDYEEFSNAYNVPYNFPSPYFGDPFFSKLENNRLSYSPCYPVC